MEPSLYNIKDKYEIGSIQTYSVAASDAVTKRKNMEGEVGHRTGEV